MSYENWVTKDGKIIKVVDMENSHLINTHRFLVRKLEHGVLKGNYLNNTIEWVIRLEDELYERELEYVHCNTRQFLEASHLRD